MALRELNPLRRIRDVKDGQVYMAVMYDLETGQVLVPSWPGTDLSGPGVFASATSPGDRTFSKDDYTPVPPDDLDYPDWPTR